MKYSFPAFENGFIRAAAASPRPARGRLWYNAEQIIGVMREYAEKNVQLLCLPEFALTGYTCSDLFLQDTLLCGAEDGLAAILKASQGLNLRGSGRSAGALHRQAVQLRRRCSATASCWALYQSCICPTMASSMKAPLHPRYARAGVHHAGRAGNADRH